MAQKDIKHLTEHNTKANKLCVLVVSVKYVTIQRKKLVTLCVFLSTSWGFIYHNIETLHCIWNQSLFKRTSQRRSFLWQFFPSVHAKRTSQQLPTFLSSFGGTVCTALPILLGPPTRITDGLQSLMGCILPTMHCRSRYCWEFFRPFSHHFQHGRNSSQHSRANSVVSCCFRLHVDLQA